MNKLYSYNSPRRRRVTQPIGGKSMTKQSFKEAQDINNILMKYKKRGLLELMLSQPNYTPDALVGDFSEVADFQSAQNAIIKAQDSFMRLPAYLRKKFDNNPGVFADYCTNPDNKEELIKLGLAVRKKKEIPNEAPSSPSPNPQTSETSEEPKT